MSSGRTSWWAKDGGWYDRERVVELGEEFGPAGPLVLDWLSCQAKLQNDGPFDAPTGVVKSGFRAVARGCFIADADIVRSIVELAAEIGALDDLAVDGRTFTCRISGWRSEQGRAAQTARKRDQRAAGQPGTDQDKPGPGAAATPRTTRDNAGPKRPPSQVVPESPTTGHDQTVELPPQPPQGGRARDTVAYEQQLSTWIAQVVPEATTPYRLPGAKSAIRDLTGRGHTVTPHAVRWLAGHGTVNSFGLTDEQRADIRAEFQTTPDTAKAAA